MKYICQLRKKCLSILGNISPVLILVYPHTVIVTHPPLLF